MGRMAKRGLVALLCAIMLLGCSRSDTRPESRLADRGDGSSEGESQSVKLDKFHYRLSGPYVHGNLAVFFLHAPHQDEREFLTLEEGLKKGLVKVSEKPDATVNELLIENQSDLPLFLQEGDRLYGGKQDRTLFTSLVIPPKSGPMPVPVFCIEPGRWSPGRSGERFTQGANPALAPLAVRNAAKLAQNQNQVWAEVAAIRGAFVDLARANAPQVFGAEAYPPSDRPTPEISSAEGHLFAELGKTSLNCVLESPAVLRLSQEYTRALEGLLNDKPDAVGVAIAVHGRFVEVNLYPSHRLLRRMYSRLIQSYVLDAVSSKDGAKSAPAPTQEELVTFLTAYQAKNKRSQSINQANRLEILELCPSGKESVELAECVTYFEGREVHRQWLRAPGIVEQRPNRAPSGGPETNRLIEP